MRIDERTFPALFHRGVFIPNNLTPDRREMYEMIVHSGQQYLSYLTKTIVSAAYENFEKLMPLRRNLTEIVRGVLMQHESGPVSVFYSISHIEGWLVVNTQMHGLETSTGLARGCLIGGRFPIADSGDTIKFYPADWCPTDDRAAAEVAKFAVCAELFLQFAEIETKVVKPADKIWDGPVCAYNNKSKVPVTIVDSSWYTNLVVSGAFKVSGHWRLQPVGPNRSARRLTWISEFQKEGYTRKAKKENRENGEFSRENTGQ